jgi:hypothetical protein
MGANQSARKITVVNDEATGVIKISDSVVQRLKGATSENSKVILNTYSFTLFGLDKSNFHPELIRI